MTATRDDPDSRTSASKSAAEIFDGHSGPSPAVSESERTTFRRGKRVLVDGSMNRRAPASASSELDALGVAAGRTEIGVSPRTP